jgi:hypothetical protein
MGKANTLLSNRNARHETIPAITAFVNSIATSRALIGDDTAYNLLTRLAAWLTPQLPRLLAILRDEHDYAMATTLIRLARWLNMLGVSSGLADVDTVFDSVSRALICQLTLDLTFTSTGSNGNVESFHLPSVFPVNCQLVNTGKTLKGMIIGEGTGKYLSYTDSDGELTMNAADFPVAMKVKSFDPCAGTGELFLDRFYSDRETYIFTDGSSAKLGVAAVGWMSLFESRMAGGG